MSLTSILLDLQQKYDCSEPLYLSNFFQPDGKKWLYDKLTTLYQPVYHNNYRLLVVQDCADQYDYVDLPGIAVTTLQQYASQIDISNSFILLITNNQNITNELDQVRKLYSTDVFPIQHQVVDQLPIFLPTTGTSKQDTFCVLPWIHLYVGTDGNVLPCCQADHRYPMGNVDELPISDIAKSTAFTQLRANMIAGVRSKECARCYQQEDSGLPSSRIKQNLRWSHITVDHYVADGTIDDFEPVYFDIRLNNICNLKCRMCSGYFSSAIAQEEKDLFGNKSSVESALKLQQRKFNLLKILEYLPYAEKIYFAGGEPLLASEHYEILDALIKCGNTDLEIVYNTNFTTLQYRDIVVTDLWRKFSRINIGASLDAVDNVAEYVRHGTKWNTIESNLELVKTQCPHVNFTVTSTVGLLNVASLIDLQKTWHTNRMLDISKFSLSVMIDPNHLTVCALPLTHKTRLEALIKNHIVWCQNNYAKELANQWIDVLNYMWSKDGSYHLTEFKRLTQLMDQHRNESLVKTIPEFQDLL
jgi:radical SAM protein with 4Fe4S-binding SPASM domain